MVVPSCGAWGSCYSYGPSYPYDDGSYAEDAAPQEIVPENQLASAPLAYPDTPQGSGTFAELPPNNGFDSSSPSEDVPDGLWVGVPGQWIGGKYVPSHVVWVPGAR